MLFMESQKYELNEKIFACILEETRTYFIIANELVNVLKKGAKQRLEFIKQNKGKEVLATIELLKLLREQIENWEKLEIELFSHRMQLLWYLNSMLKM